MLMMMMMMADGDAVSNINIPTRKRLLIQENHVFQCINYLTIFAEEIQLGTHTASKPIIKRLAVRLSLLPSGVGHQQSQIY